MAGQSKPFDEGIRFIEVGTEPLFFANYYTYESMKSGNVMASAWVLTGFTARLQYRVIVPAPDLSVTGKKAGHAAAEAHNLVAFLSEFDGEPN